MFSIYSVLFYLVIWALMIYWTYKIAERNGRDKGWAILWGALFGLWAVIFYAIWGKSKTKREEEIREAVKKVEREIK